MRSNVENRRQPVTNELVGSLLVRWGFVPPWGQNPCAEMTPESGPTSDCVYVGGVGRRLRAKNASSRRRRAYSGKFMRRRWARAGVRVCLLTEGA